MCVIHQAPLRSDKENLQQQVEQLQTNHNDFQQRYNRIQASNEILQNQVKDLTTKVDLLILEIK
jgi:phage shock protein A